ncbi:MAG TPA: response regulator [Ramlibacter sp.]|uniref:response regulator n=1 Tax=Ramlibacter sp. TaxID=1917967 RepID=UPI002D7EE720|nr:response regulator [Ramlibacter sp.]HET8745571.1 response regulator [Ramlibacter sp.]
MHSPVIRVGIVDDQKIVRSALRGYLAMASGIECVGEAANADEAVELVRSRELDVLVLDLLMPGSQELEALHRVREAAPHLRILVLSAYPAERYGPRAVAAGAASYLEKANGPADRVVREIRAVAEGRGSGSWEESDERDAAPEPSPVAWSNDPIAGPWPLVGGSATDLGWQSIARTVFWLLLVVVSFSMTLPEFTLQLLRSYSPWLDNAALLSLMLGDNLDHILAFGALGISARFAYPQANASHCTLILAAVAIVTELVQLWSPGRDPALPHVVLDLVSGTIGFGLGSLASTALIPKSIPQVR